MPTENININLTTQQSSEMVQEIVSSKPSFIVRYGTLFFLIILLLLILATYFIQYPNIIPTTAKLTSINPPKPVITNINGKLIKLNIKEDDSVSQNQILGFMEATANHTEILKLLSTLEQIQNLVNNNNAELIQQQFQNKSTNLGELQSSYQTFATAFLSFKNYLDNGFYLHKKIMLSTDMANFKRLHNNLFEQKNLNEQDLDLAQTTFSANESLKKDNVISAFDYRNEKSKLINKKLTLPQITNAIINNEAQQNEKQKEIAELENTIAQQKTIFTQALNTFKSQVDDWKKKYLLIAPISGKVAFATFIQENQQLQVNQTICFINPENSQYNAQIVIPQSNFGKVVLGQEVLLKFPSYPFQEYGAIKGKIDFISHIPTDSGYVAKVTLPNGLTTNHQKQIQFREGLSAQGEIITKDMRLLERFYYSIVTQVKK